jgi:hypothetical protein
MDMQKLGKQTLEACRQRGWAGMETGISRPVPEVTGGQVRLWYLLYRSQVRPPYQMLYEPSAAVAVDYATGQILERRELPTSTPPKALGRYPHAAAAAVPRDRWQATWDELFGLYPDVIAAFAGQAAVGQREKVKRFAELWELTASPFMAAYYRALNPVFFEWLGRVLVA